MNSSLHFPAFDFRLSTVLHGEKALGENVTLRTDPFDPRMPGRPWGGRFGGEEWLPAQRVTWVEKGVIKNMTCDRYWAKKTNKPPVAFPSNVILHGGTATLDDLIASTDRGLLITHFWYIRFLQRQTMQLTGLTRDGVFYIEKGKIQYAVNNFRFNESVVEMLSKVEGMTALMPVSFSILPTIKVRDFNMSSHSDAV